jgi:hypothetical protein
MNSASLHLIMTHYPTKEEFFYGDVPDGYLLICPFCNQEVPDCYFLREDGGFVLSAGDGFMPVAICPNQIVIFKRIVRTPARGVAPNCASMLKELYESLTFKMDPPGLSIPPFSIHAPIDTRLYNVIPIQYHVSNRQGSHSIG